LKCEWSLVGYLSAAAFSVGHTIARLSKGMCRLTELNGTELTICTLRNKMTC